MEIFCHKCKQKNPAGAQFCKRCAAPLAAQGSSNSARNQNRSPVNGPQTHGQNPFMQSNSGASTRAVSALVLTVCSLVMCCVFTSVPAAILGWMEIDSIKRGESSPQGMVMAQISLWGGVALTMLTLFTYFLLALSSAANAAG